MTQRLTQLLTIAVLLVCTLAGPGVSSVAAKSPFDDLPAVRNKLLLHEGRHVLAPTFAFTANDPYKANVLVGANWRYYIQSWFGIGIDVAGGFGVNTALNNRISEEITTDTKAFNVSATSLQLLTHATLELVPIEGKFLLAGGRQIRMDLHILAGFGMAMVAGEGRIDDEITWLPVVGAGMRFFPSNWLAIGIDIRDYMINRVLAMRRDGSIPGGELTHNLATTFSIGFFLPTEPTIEP
jgi:outer membrane beta-barrel protein